MMYSSISIVKYIKKTGEGKGDYGMDNICKYLWSEMCEPSLALFSHAKAK